MNSAPRDKQGVAGGVLALMRSAGMITGLTLAAAIVQSNLGGTARGSLSAAGDAGPAARRGR